MINKNKTRKAGGTIIEVNLESSQAVVWGLLGWRGDRLNLEAPIQVKIYSAEDEDQQNIVASGYIVRNIGLLACVAQLTQVFSIVQAGMSVNYVLSPEIPPSYLSGWDRPAVSSDGLGFLHCEKGDAWFFTTTMFIGLIQKSELGPCRSEAPIVNLKSNREVGIFKPWDPIRISAFSDISHTFTYSEGVAWASVLRPSFVDLQEDSVVRPLNTPTIFNIVGVTALLEVVGLEKPELGDLIEIMHGRTDGGGAFTYGYVCHVWEGPLDPKYRPVDLNKCEKGLYFRPCTVAVVYGFEKLWFGPLSDTKYYRFRKCIPGT